MRILLAAVLAACGLVLASPHASAQPVDCPPNCDRIPSSAWLPAAALPLHGLYRWPEPATLAAPVTAPRFRFEDECATPAADDDRSYAVAARAAATSPDGQWQLQAQVVHWRGETWRGGQIASAVFDDAVAALRACQLTTPVASPTLTTADSTRAAAVVSVAGRTVLHEYLLLDPRSSSITELAMWSAPVALVPWPIVADRDVFDALAAPLCTAYIGSCR